MTSGQMWNHIRGPPYAHKNPSTGQIVSWMQRIHLKCFIMHHWNNVKMCFRVISTAAVKPSSSPRRTSFWFSVSLIISPHTCYPKGHRPFGFSLLDFLGRFLNRSCFVSWPWPLCQMLLLPWEWWCCVKLLPLTWRLAREKVRCPHSDS